VLGFCAWGAGIPGHGTPNGFHIRCINAIASCAENCGGVFPAGGFVESVPINFP